MPRIDDRILDCALYLYASEEDAQRGAHIGGSGFLVGISFGGDDFRHADNLMERTADQRHLYAVTASHVAADAPVVRLNTKDGNLYTQTPVEWIHHRSGDDVAIAPLNLDSRVHQFKFIGTNFFINEERWQNFRLGPGDETFMVGRFINRDETQSNMPVTRFGHIAGSRPEPLDQRPYRNVTQESILVEVHSVAGFSGSPVFVSVPFYRLKPLHDERAQRQFKRQVLQSAQDPWDHLLGVEWGVRDTALSVDASPAGMAGVVPAWKVIDLLFDPVVIQMRQRREAEERDRAAVTRGTGRQISLTSRKGRPTQQTTPKDGEPIEIPVPTKKQFARDLGKLMRRKP